MKLHTKIISLSGAGLLLVLLAIFIRPGADEAVPAAAAATGERIETSPQESESETAESSSAPETEKDYIKWVDFNVPMEALQLAYEYDVNSVSEPVHLNWIWLLSYTASRYGGEFPAAALSFMRETAGQVLNGEADPEALSQDQKYFSYYQEAYHAVLGGMVGSYQIQLEDGTWEKRYGLKAFSPIAKGFDYSDYDDFGVARSYGYRRQHLGHDMMGLTGTPIIAVESGTVEALGWNQYGGWRIGIRSFDQKRYYYYAHLRQNVPFQSGLKEGSIVQAGDVIGYMGHTGYSAKENTNNIDETHLHFGLQLIFDESQKEGNNEIWIDCYQLIQFLKRNRCTVVRNDESKEWSRAVPFRDEGLPELPCLYPQ